MKKLICFSILFFSYILAFSQAPAAEKKIKEINPVSDTTLFYPLRGVIQTRMIYGPLDMIEVEYYVYDANGEIIYNNVENYRASMGVTTFDAEYMRYMTLQGNYYMLRNGYAPTHSSDEFAREGR